MRAQFSSQEKLKTKPVSSLDGAVGWIVGVWTEVALMPQLCLPGKDIQSPVQILPPPIVPAAFGNPEVTFKCGNRGLERSDLLKST